MTASPLRQIARLGTVAAIVLAALGWRAATVEAGPGAPLRLGWHVAADTDTVALPLPDSLPNAFPDDPFGEDPLQSIVDSLVDARFDDVDSTLAADSTERARRYLPGTAYDDPFGLRTIAPPVPRRTPALRGRLGSYWNRDVTLDTSVYRYTVRQQAGTEDVRVPSELDLREFLVTRRAADLDDGFRSLAAGRANRANRRGGVGVTFDIPGGEQSAFSTIFGKNEVDLRVNGTSNVNLGLSYDQSEYREALNGDEGVFSPDFGQELNLTVRGTIGDKLAINVNYDTQSQFEFENQVSLVYTGYEDDIVQRIEAGNVFLQTPAELIRGGQRLFGIRTDLQLGPLALKAVASQQDAETREVVIDGGAQATAFDLAPYDYEEDTHFFLGYAFHNWWDEGHRDAGIRIAPPGYAELIGLEVWKYDPSVTNNTTNDDETTYAVALADLGEPEAVLTGGEEYLEFRTNALDGLGLAPLPDSTLDKYSPADLADIRENYASIDFESRFGLQIGSSYATNQFKKLRANVDYTVDDELGYVSLTTALNETDVIAVAYQYRRTDGEVITVGDYASATQSNTQSGPRSLLKLLRVNGQTPTDPLWDLSMRNIYRIGGRSLNASSFELGITYEAPGQSPRDELPAVTIGEQLSALQVFGLDRTNEQGQATPDNLFDFVPGVTVEPAGGRVIFPVRQPYGDYLRRVLTEGVLVGGETVAVTPIGTTVEALLSALVPTSGGDDLYDLRSVQAERQLQGLSRFSLSGEFKSATQSIFNVGFNLVEGTVRVTSGERELTEGADFRVNTSQGTVEITNPLYLQSGQQVRIQVEQNQFFSIGSKTLVGLRADYRLSEDASLGGTWMRLSERPLVDKFRIGEEALQNTIVGLDGAYTSEPRWLTRAVDALPLIQTRAPSRFELRGEVARLSPSHPETFAFEQTRRTLQNDGFDLTEDELAGVSYVDDFEGSENAFTALGESGGWRIAAAPDSSGPADAIPAAQAESILDPRLASNWRGSFAWYTIPSLEAYRRFSNLGLLTRATARVLPEDLYNRVGLSASARAQPLSLLDLYFDPTRRGAYNYNGELATTFAQDPRTVWGGMTRGIDAAYSDFEGQNNIEYIELLMQPLGGRDGTETIEPGAVLYVDLGRINEDVLPNGSLNAEDGLRDGGVPGAELDRWGRRPSVQTNGAVDYFDQTGRTEDLGLDGLPSAVADNAGEPYELDERTFFSGGATLPNGTPSADFLGTLQEGTLEFARATRDPSLDDYHHFEDEAFFSDPALFPGGASVQERYSQYFPAFELNSIVAQNNIARSGEPGISTLPNSEDINQNSTVDALDAFHRYAIPLDDAGLRASPFFQNDITFLNQDTGFEDTFYLLRIPVRTDNRSTSRGLDRDDFSRIEAVRVWTTGHVKPATMRVASFELVGSQWLQSEQIGPPERTGDPTRPDPDVAGGAELFIESVNSEESPLTYAPPRTTIRPVQRDFAGGQGGLIREQSIVLRAEDLPEGYAGAITRTYSTRPLDLTKYSNLRMFTHGHGFERRDSVRVFIRLGDDETENYYEYSQPLYPFDPARAPDVDPQARPDSLWQTNVPVGGGETLDLNSVNIVLSELNRLKVARDNAGVSVEEIFRSTTTPEGAPPGARIAVRGQPSVQDVKVITLGLRNGQGGLITPIDTATVWFNELRVAGYDEQEGAAGFVTASLALADLANVNARFSFTDDGFGDLGSGLGEREFADRTAFSVQSTFNAHKLLPERFGWSVPVSVSVTQNASTPRFDPDRGDILLQDLAEQARTDSTLAETDRTLRAEQILERAQTVSSSRTVRVPISKRGSRSPWLKYTVDALSLAYSNTAQRARNPSNTFNDLDSWRGDLSYRLSVPRPKTIAPLWLLRPIPLLGALGDLKLNVLPRQLSLSGDIGRSVSASQPRLSDIGLAAEPDSLRDFQIRTRRTQSFTHGRQMDMQYDPFTFLNLTYGSNVAQDLGAAGQNESFRIFARTVVDPDDPDAVAVGRAFDGISPDSARAPGSIVRQELGLADNDPIEILGGSNLEVLAFGDAFNRVFRPGGGFVRTQDYQQTANAALRISTQKVKWLSWIRPQAISFGTSYRWTDTPLPSRPELDIASTQTRAQVQAGIQFQPRTFWRLFPFYRTLEGARGTSGGARGRQAPRGRGRQSQGETADAPADTTSSRRGLFGRLARGTFLALTGIEDVSFTYRGTLSAAAGGVTTDGFSLLSAFAGDAPSLGYRLGLDRSLPLAFRLADETTGLRYDDRIGDQHDLQARTQLEPFRGLRIGLNWQAGWSENETFNYEYLGDGVVQRFDPELRGTGESTVFSVGASYDTFLERQIDRLEDDLDGTPNDAGQFTSDFRSRNGLAKDFLEEFGRGPGRYGAEALLSLPSPGWDVTYSGLGNWPLLQRLTNQVTLRHGYLATNASSYASIVRTSPDVRSVILGEGGAQTLVAPDVDVEASTMTVNERFQPLLGLAVGWKAGFQTDLTWNRSNLYTLQTNTAQFVEKNVEDIQVQFSFTKNGIKIPLFKRLNNNIRFTLTAGISDDETLTRSIGADLEADLVGDDRVEPGISSVRRVSVWPRLSYSLSNRVTADVFVRYEQSQPQGTQAFPTSSFDGGVTFRISFSN